MRVVVLLVAITTLAFLWIFAPFFQPVLMYFVIHPLQLIILIAALGLMLVSGRKRISVRFRAFQAILFSLLVFVFVGLLFIEGELQFKAAARLTNFETRQVLPTFSPIRLTPKSVARRFAEDSFQNPQEYLGDSQIVLVGGKLKRVFPRLPDGLILKFANKLAGFVVVDVDTLARNVGIEDTRFEYSEGVAIFDNLKYQLPRHKFFVHYSSEPVYLKDDKGAWVTLVPYIGYRGFPIRTPYWAGVMLIHSDGKIEDLTPEQAQAVSYLKGNRLYPKELAVYLSHAYSYRNGILNKWFLHKEEVEIVSLPDDEAVLHVSTDEGYKQMIVAEPYGRSYGIYRIFWFDATSGKLEVMEFDKNSQLTGPVVAADYIKKEFPTYDWSSFKLAEPRPLSVKGELYWLMSIVPNDNAGIAMTVLLNAKNNLVVKVNTQEELERFISEGKVVNEENKSGDRENVIQKIESIEKELREIKEYIKK